MRMWRRRTWTGTRMRWSTCWGRTWWTSWRIYLSRRRRKRRRCRGARIRFGEMVEAMPFGTVNHLGLTWIWDLDGWIVAAAVLCALSCALLGNFMVLRRMSMMGDALSHAVLPGLAAAFLISGSRDSTTDRKSTRLNSSHLVISYAVFCLKKKKTQRHYMTTAR